MLWAKVKFFELLELANGSLLMVSGNHSSVLHKAADKALASQILERRGELVSSTEFLKEYPSISTNMQELFLHPVADESLEIKSIHLHGDGGLEFELIKETDEFQALLTASDGHVNLHVGHFHALSLDEPRLIEDLAADNDYVLISTIIRNMHFIVGPVVRRYNTPSFVDFFDNWRIFEENRLTKNRSWFSVLDFALENKIHVPPTIAIDGATTGLIAFNISKSIRKIVAAPAPYYPWEEAFGVSVCDLETGDAYFDTLAHSIRAPRRAPSNDQI